ncbi:hypothetical protein HOD96_03905 [Candidatus Falkowbacteria bacterium]|jgi:YidC/Oxa1 family membrane protein insertase|nr:hypothetical protein [Candidatus Falkowbacteria bacterium]MBT4433567.1 hypothetical protein [Candidatus Falkowbacteria bacterium]
MLLTIWNDFLYEPLLNLLIVLYGWHDIYSLGFAVIGLTIILRIVLLPFTFFAQRNKVRYEQLAEEVRKIEKDFNHDPEKMKSEVRLAMKKYKIRPWAKAIVLGVQALVLVVLYQVFMGGINNKLDAIYEGIYQPDFINTIFWGIDLKEQNIFLASLVGISLFIEIWYNQRKIKNVLQSSDIFFKYLFPIFSIIILIMLPAVKSVFILTSIFFTVIVSVILRLFIKPAKK